MAINTPPHIHQLVICANVFIRKGDQYLVLRRSPLKKYAPNVVHPVGGKVDPDENPYVAATREVVEEAGVTVKNLRLEAVLTEIRPVKDEPYNWLIFYFSGDYESGEIITTDEGELIWLTSEEIKGAPLLPPLRQVIDRILDPQEGTVFVTLSYDEEGRIVESAEGVSVCAL